MDPILWLLLAGVVAVLLVGAIFIQRKYSGNNYKKNDGPSVIAQPARAPAIVAGGVRRPQSRNVRARIAAVQRARQVPSIREEDELEEEDSEHDAERDHIEDLVSEMVEEKEMKTPGGKIGTKKLKKLQEKAERKAMREQEEVLRADRKKREALRDEERKREEKEEKIRLKKEEEEQRLLKEEQERREHEEYLKLKETFEVEEEGQDGNDEDSEAKGIQDFIDYIKKTKVVYMEDLAAEFNLKTQDAISRVQSLQDSGDLTGVVDDRGKFIFISQTELQAVANFIKQRGRVSIAELVSSSNTLVNLQAEERSSMTVP